MRKLEAGVLEADSDSAEEAEPDDETEMNTARVERRATADAEVIDVDDEFGDEEDF